MLVIAGEFAGIGRIQNALGIARRQPANDAMALTLATILQRTTSEEPNART